MTDSDNTNPAPELVAVPEPTPEAPASIHLDLRVEEADALHQWLLKSTNEGATALDVPLVAATLSKLSHSLDFIHTVTNVREELEQAGFDTRGMSDDQVADLTRRIREANQPRPH